jgi:hypothetical protein
MATEKIACLRAFSRIQSPQPFFRLFNASRNSGLIELPRLVRICANANGLQGL